MDIINIVKVSKNSNKCLSFAQKLCKQIMYPNKMSKTLKYNRELKWETNTSIRYVTSLSQENSRQIIKDWLFITIYVIKTGYLTIKSRSGLYGAKLWLLIKSKTDRLKC